MADRMSEHHASVTVNAPVHQVYSLFSHFNDFPKFMSFVKEVTYYDNQRSHWVAEVVGVTNGTPSMKTGSRTARLAGVRPMVLRMREE